MKNPIFLILALFTLFSCGDDDGGDSMQEPSTFTVTIENVGSAYPFYQGGIFNTPVGASDPAPLLPGEDDMYQFTFHAGNPYLPGTPLKVSFATMLVASNDLFFAPKGTGISLYDDNGDPITGDVTDQIYLWDAGTEVNRMPGSTDQPGPNNDPTGTGTSESENVTLLEEMDNVIPVTVINTEGGSSTYNYPAVSEMIKVTLTNDGTEFTLTVENMSGGEFSSPLSPGGFVVHTADNPLFEAGMMAMDNGLEEIAEDGMPGELESYLDGKIGIIAPLSPGVWAVHNGSSMPLFEMGAADYGDGLEHIAEDGNATPLGAAAADRDGVIEAAIFNTPNGSSAAGPATPGNSFSFTFDASPGDYLSFATMFAQSNDWFYGFGDMGLALFNGETPVTGDVTSSVMLFDVGTEEDEYPGAGPTQVIRQGGSDIGPADDDNMVRTVTSSGIIPATSQQIKVTISVN